MPLWETSRFAKTSGTVVALVKIMLFIRQRTDAGLPTMPGLKMTLSPVRTMASLSAFVISGGLMTVSVAELLVAPDALVTMIV